MRQYLPNIHPASIIVQGSNQTRLVSTNVKHGEFSDSVSRREASSQFCKGREISSLHLSIPMLQSTPGLRMMLRKLIEPLSSNDAHASTLLLFSLRGRLGSVPPHQRLPVRQTPLAGHAAGAFCCHRTQRCTQRFPAAPMPQAVPHRVWPRPRIG